MRTNKNTRNTHEKWQNKKTKHNKAINKTTKQTFFFLDTSCAKKLTQG